MARLVFCLLFLLLSAAAHAHGPAVMRARQAVEAALGTESSSESAHSVVEKAEGRVAAAWQVVQVRLFMYHGWNVVAEFDAASPATGSPRQLAQSYLWGTDLSGTPQGAGGVGGLLVLTDHRTGGTGSHGYAYDGNGNVLAVIDGMAAGIQALCGGDLGVLASQLSTAARENAQRGRQFMAEASQQLGGNAARGTGTVWDSVKATQPLYEGTAIPRSFELATGNGKVWVHANATEHMAEYATSMLNRGVSPSLVDMGTQAQMTSLQSAVNAATANGVQYGKLINVGGWELKFGAPQQAGQLPALIHAMPK